MNEKPSATNWAVREKPPTLSELVLASTLNTFVRKKDFGCYDDSMLLHAASNLYAQIDSKHRQTLSPDPSDTGIADARDALTKIAAERSQSWAESPLGVSGAIDGFVEAVEKHLNSIYPKVSK